MLPYLTFDLFSCVILILEFMNNLINFPTGPASLSHGLEGENLSRQKLFHQQKTPYNLEVHATHLHKFILKAWIVSQYCPRSYEDVAGNVLIIFLAQILL